MYSLRVTGTENCSVADSAVFDRAVDQLTLECWVYLISASPSSEELMEKTNQYGMRIDVSGHLTITLDTTGGGWQGESGTNENWIANSWHHLAVCYDNDNNIAQGWVNGIRVMMTTSRWNGSFPLEDSGSNAFQVGGSNNDMYISEMRVSSVARYTGSRIRVPKDRFENDVNTLALWHMDEGTGTVVKDYSGNSLAMDFAAPSSDPNWSVGGMVPKWVGVKPRIALAPLPIDVRIIPVEKNIGTTYRFLFDSPPDDSSLPNGWTRVTGSTQLKTNTTYGVWLGSSASVYYHWDKGVGSEDMWCETFIGAIDSSGAAFAASGPCVRMQEDGGCYYFRQNAGGNLNLERVNGAGSFQWGKNVAHTATVGDRIRLEIRTVGGTANLRGYVNGVLVIEVNESSVNDADAVSPLRGSNAGLYFNQSDRVIGLNEWSAGSLSKKVDAPFLVALPDVAKVEKPW